MKQNDQAQAPPAQENQEAEKVTAGGCPAAPCSAPVNGYLKFVGKSLNKVEVDKRGIHRSDPVELTWIGKILYRICLKW